MRNAGGLVNHREKVRKHSNHLEQLLGDGGLESMVSLTDAPAEEGGQEGVNVVESYPLRIAEAPERLVKARVMSSSGRVHLPDSSLCFSGTGLVVGPGLVMANRHVARILAGGPGIRRLRSAQKVDNLLGGGVSLEHLQPFEQHAKA